MVITGIKQVICFVKKEISDFNHSDRNNENNTEQEWNFKEASNVEFPKANALQEILPNLCIENSFVRYTAKMFIVIVLNSLFALINER